MRTLATAIALLFATPAGIGDSVPALFLKLVNDALKGSIEAREIHYVAPSSVVLADAALKDPSGNVVAKVARAEATVSLSSLLAGDIVISRIDLADPRLGLVLSDGKLNLLEALRPRKPIPKNNKPNKTAFRIDTIVAHGGGFTFTDQKNVTVTAENIDASASLEVDLGHDLVVVDVREPHVAKGVVQLPQLDVPISNVAAKGARVFIDRVELVGVTGIAAGAKVAADGFIVVKDAGNLQLHGTVDAPKNAWPDRLKKLPFDTPAVHAIVDVTGPFQDPHVAVDGSFAHASAYGYDVDAGRGVVEVTKDVVKIKDGTYVKAGGTVAALGTVALPSLQADLKLRAIDVPVARALEPAELDPAPKGTITGRATLSGVVDGEKPITIDANVTAHKTEISAVKLRSDVDASARVIVRPKENHVDVDNATVKGDKLEAHGSGDVFTAEERIAFKIDASADDATGLVPAVPDQIHADRATFSGTVSGPYKAVKVEGRVASATGSAYGVPIANVAAHVVASADVVDIDGLSATAADGAVALTKPIHIVLKGKQHPITGTALVTGANLALIKNSTSGEALPLAGRADVEATLTGPYDDPIVKLRAAAGGLVVQDEELGAAVANGYATKKALVVDNVSVSGGIARAHGEDIKLAIPSLVVDGHVHIEELDLARIAAAKSAKLAGVASGIAIVRGDVTAPDIDAKLAVQGLTAGAQKYGDGSVDVLLAPEALPSTTNGKSAKDAKPELGHIVKVSARVGSSAGTFAVRAAYAIERKVVNASAKLDRVDLAPFTAQLGTAVAPLHGLASGTIDASGSLDHLDMNATLRTADLAVARASTPAPAQPNATVGPPVETPTPLRSLGAVEIEARMDQGALSAQVCAFPLDKKDAATVQADTGSPCDVAEKVWATIVGDVDLANGAVDVAINGEIDENELEDFFPALSSRGLDVGVKAQASAQIVKPADKPVDVRAQATLLSASVQPPGALRAELVDKAGVLWADDRLRIVDPDDDTKAKPAHFKAPGGGADVLVGGSIGAKDIDLDVDGVVALGIAKAFTQQIANASGTAQTKLSLKGTYDKGVAIEGSLTPARDARVTPRALGQEITFQSGSVAFAPAEGDQILVSAKDLHAKLGDGEVVVRGNADVRTSRNSDQGWVARWDVSLSGTGIELRYGSGRAEGAVDVSLKGDEAQPKLTGRVELTDGQYRKTLELRNFVLQSAPEKESEPLWQTLSPIGLENLQLDVALSVQNFRVRANVVNFNADLQVRGDLKLKNTLRVPQLDGAVQSEEGTVDFPRVRFDVQEMQIEFPPQPSGGLNPLIHLSAHTELPPGMAGNDTEIPVDLTLDGYLQKGLNLDLTATDPQRDWSRSDLFGLVLFGKLPASLVAGGGVDTNIAVSALLSEAAAPFTAPLEQFVQKNLGAQVELDAGGWRWQIGRRLELEGPGLLIAQSTGTTTSTGETYVPGAASYGTTATATGASGAVAASAAAASPSTAEDAVRMRFLILDPVHLGPVPLGKNLSLLGSSSSIGQELRLSLRIVEE